MTDSKRTLDLYAEPGMMLKPGELIDIRGASNLTLAARRLYNDLIARSFGPEMGENGTEWTVRLSELRGLHASNDRIEDSIEALMRTLVVIRSQDGTQKRYQLLGSNTLWSGEDGSRKLTYSLGKGMPELLRDSRVFGKLDSVVMHHMTSKYALSLYEIVAKRVRLKHKFAEQFALDDLRDLLGVPAGKLRAYHQLRQKALEPSVAEVNQLAEFGCRFDPIKDGRKIVAVRLSWWLKDDEAKREAYAELHRHRVGRKARRTGAVEAIEVAEAIAKDD